MSFGQAANGFAVSALGPVVVIGDIMADIHIKPLRAVRKASDTEAVIRLGAGGAGANVAVHLAQEGAAALLIGRVGDDDLGRFVLERLSATGVHLAVEPAAGAATGAIGVVVEAGGQRTMFPQRGANSAVDEAYVARWWPRPTAVFVSGYTLFDPATRAAGQWALRRAREAGLCAAVDAASYAFLQDAGPGRFLQWAEDATVMMVNREEGAVLAGSSDPERVLAVLAERFPVAVLKLDRDGAAARAGNEEAWVPAQTVPVVDTTGAGDAFDAGFLAARLAGRPLRAAVSAGVRRASEAVQHLGAWTVPAGD
ncbi:MAG: hypothetical protein H0Z37_01625 [Firmicutes bacterium]|nr:hypothetical protein [Bacillota bacterium]